MITIHRVQDYTITVEGHAGQAPIGHDIVCAGVSALVGALAEVIARNRNKWVLSDLRINSGNTVISVAPKPEFNAYCRAIFDTVSCGFEHIEALYPDFVKYFQETTDLGLPFEEDFLV